MNELINVKLALDIIYITGTVNGEIAEFSLSALGIWTAVVPKAIDGKYVVEITAYNSLGTPTHYYTVIYKLEEMIPPKVDWTSEDDYNAGDLNRVEANTQFVADFIRSIYYVIPDLEIKTDRDETSIDFISSIKRVEENIDTIRRHFITPLSYEDKREWVIGNEPQRFDYRDANRLEKNLLSLYEWAVIAKENLIYCGTFNCGEEGVIY